MTEVIHPVKPIYGVFDFQAQVVLPLQENPPVDPIEGSVYADTDDRRIYMWHDGKWRASTLTALAGDGIVFEFDEQSGLTVISVDPAYAPEPVAGGTYHYVQDTPSSAWTIIHNLGFRPNVTTQVNIGEPTLSEAIGDVDHPNVNTVVVTFAKQVTGEAFLS